MQKELRDESTFHRGEDKNTFESLSTTKKVGIASGGALLVCCVFLCPCFYKKRREAAHNVLDEDVNSSKSLTSQPCSETCNSRLSLNSLTKCSSVPFECIQSNIRLTVLSDLSILL